MTKSSIALIASRLWIMLSTLGIVFLNTRFLGTAGQGDAGIINLGILIVASISMFVTGGAVVFIMPRLKAGSTIFPALLWSTLTAIASFIFFKIVPIIPDEFIIHVVALGWMQSLFTFNMQVLLGKLRFMPYTISLIIQSALSFISLLLFFILEIDITIQAFLKSLYISFVITLLFTIWAAKDEWLKMNLKEWKKALSELFNYGKWGQTGNVFHLLNQRLNFSLLDILIVQGKASAGILSIAMYGAEVVWTVAKSLSTEQYALIANSTDRKEQQLLTKKNMRTSLLLGVAAFIGIWIVPPGFYFWILPDRVDTIALANALLWLAPGILANSASIIFAHYFSGIGKHYHNGIASALGFAIGLPASILLISNMGLEGAAAGISISFIIQVLYFIWYWRKERPTTSDR